MSSSFSTVVSTYYTQPLSMVTSLSLGGKVLVYIFWVSGVSMLKACHYIIITEWTHGIAAGLIVPESSRPLSIHSASIDDSLKTESWTLPVRLLKYLVKNKIISKSKIVQTFTASWQQVTGAQFACIVLRTCIHCSSYLCSLFLLTLFIVLPTSIVHCSSDLCSLSSVHSEFMLWFSIIMTFMWNIVLHALLCIMYASATDHLLIKLYTYLPTLLNYLFVSFTSSYFFYFL